MLTFTATERSLSPSRTILVSIPIPPAAVAMPPTRTRYAMRAPKTVRTGDGYGLLSAHCETTPPTSRLPVVAQFAMPGTTTISLSDGFKSGRADPKHNP